MTGIRFHHLLHTYATLLARNFNPKIVQEMPGHANLSEIMDTYLHALQNAKGSVFNKM